MDNTLSMYQNVKRNWDVVRFVPVEGKDSVNFASYEDRKNWLGEELNWCRFECRLPVGKPTKHLSTRNSDCICYSNKNVSSLKGFFAI